MSTGLSNHGAPHEVLLPLKEEPRRDSNKAFVLMTSLSSLTLGSEQRRVAAKTAPTVIRRPSLTWPRPYDQKSIVNR